MATARYGQKHHSARVQTESGGSTLSLSFSPSLSLPLWFVSVSDSISLSRLLSFFLLPFSLSLVSVEVS